MDKAVEVAKDDFAAIRTGRANPSMFAKLIADYYGTPTPIQQLAVVHRPGGRGSILITPYDKSAMARHREGDPRLRPRRQPVQRRQASSGSCSPSSPRSAARSTSRSPRPRPRTAKVSIRNIRRNAKETLDKLEKDGEAGEDDVTGAEKELDAITKQHVDADRRAAQAQGSRAARGLSPDRDARRHGATRRARRSQRSRRPVKAEPGRTQPAGGDRVRRRPVAAIMLLPGVLGARVHGHRGRRRGRRRLGDAPGPAGPRHRPAAGAADGAAAWSWCWSPTCSALLHWSRRLPSPPW